MLLLGGFVVGIGAGFLIFHSENPFSDTFVSREGGYQFINPLLSCDISEDVPDPQLKGLRNSLQATIDSLKKSGAITRASIYFRDMDGGTWTGVNENDLYAPASLIKVPLLIAYLNESRTNAALLSKTFALTGEDHNAAEYFKPARPLERGRVYTVQELLNAMIEGSDNNATEVLRDAVASSSLADVFDAFGVPSSPDQNADSLDPKDYMRFFRILYNGSYLGRTRSVAALEMMSKTEFTQGLVAGVPAGTTVSHKFGERAVTDTNGGVEKRELSDCGIVYYRGAPYGLCVMTEGSDFNTLAGAIAQISNTAYTAVNNGLLKRN